MPKALLCLPMPSLDPLGLETVIKTATKAITKAVTKTAIPQRKITQSLESSTPSPSSAGNAKTAPSTSGKTACEMVALYCFPHE